MKILYISPQFPIFNQRINALRRLGHTVDCIDPYKALAASKYVKSWVFHTGGLGLLGGVEKYVAGQTDGEHYDVVYIDTVEIISSRLMQFFRKISSRIIHYNNDNPFVFRDHWRWRNFIAISERSDITVTPRQSTYEKIAAHRSINCVRVYFSADEDAHQPTELVGDDIAKFSSEVAFVGTWMPERGGFLSELVDRGVPLRIFGPNWQKAPEYSKLSSRIHAKPVRNLDYAKAVAGAQISLGLLSKGNQDLHTTRSFEIPAIGSLLCAEWTTEHAELYENGKEAVFWRSAEDCANRCMDLLGNPEQIRSIASAGRKRLFKNGNYNEPTLKKILDTALG